jgi:hypothetical protein
LGEALSLGVEKKKGGNLPWKYPGDIGQILFTPSVAIGSVVCAEAVIGRPSKFTGHPPGDSFWGWDDEYYYGNPRYNTFVVGKMKEQELAGLGLLRWFHGGRATPTEETDYWLGQHNLRMYQGSATDTSSPLEIPAFLAFASSQVEGDPVVSKGTPNAQGKLISVYFPTKTSGASFGILH